MQSNTTIADALTSTTTNTVVWPYPERTTTYIIRQKQQTTPTADLPVQSSEPTELRGESWSINISDASGRSRPLVRVTVEYSASLEECAREMIIDAAEDLKEAIWEII